MTREELICSQLPLVPAICWGLRSRLPHSMEFQDLVGAAYLALIGAADRYDTTRGASFATYAGRRMKGAALDAIRSHCDTRKGRLSPKLVRLDDVSAEADHALGSCSLPFIDPYAARRIRAWLRGLTHQQRMVIELVFFRDYTQREAAARLRVSESRICQLRTAALKKLTVFFHLATV